MSIVNTTSSEQSIPPILIFGYGNPSRGDDSLAPVMLERISQHIDLGADLELLTDFQLQVEHSLDMMGRELILFIDASVSCSAPFEFLQLDCANAQSATPGYTTHTLTPTELIEAYKSVHHHEPPPSFLLTIRGEQFELGAALSDPASDNLQQGLRWVKYLLDNRSLQQWQQALSTKHQQVA